MTDTHIESYCPTVHTGAFAETGRGLDGTEFFDGTEFLAVSALAAVFSLSWTALRERERERVCVYVCGYAGKGG